MDKSGSLYLTTVLSSPQYGYETSSDVLPPPQPPSPLDCFTSCHSGWQIYLTVSYSDWVWSKINFLVGSYEHLQATVKNRKPVRFGHNVTRHDSFSRTILQDTAQGGRRRGRLRKCWMDSVEKWTSLPTSEMPTMASHQVWPTLSCKAQ